MDKYLKMFKPAMTKWLRDHYPLDEAKKRWKKTVYLDEKWIREEGDLGGKKNPMASNMLEAAEKYRGKEWGNTWVMRMNPDGHDKGIAFVYDTCPLNDFARRHGYLDFLPNLCYIDQITCSAAHGKLIRHKTLADGDGECNYWILGDKDPDALADVGSK